MPRCPGCYVPMVRVEEEGIRHCSCGKCFGVWIRNVALTRRVRMDVTQVGKEEGKGLAGMSLEDLAEIVAASDTKEELRCPECEKPMVKDRFHLMIPVEIDRCKGCQGVWLDSGEYSMIRRLYVEVSTSTDERIVRMREKAGAVGAAWEGRATASEDFARAVGSGLPRRGDGVDDIVAIGLNVLLGMLR